jgi:pyridoxamine 5'-phosphate oxidase
MGISDLRREYNLTGLSRKDLAPDPYDQFRHWFAQATGERTSGRLRKLLIRFYKKLVMVTGAEPMDMNAMTLATADEEGRPSARVVLLKGLDDRGFIFFTNYDSRKGRELATNANAALVFYWPAQERQVCVAGVASKLPQAESEAYFHSRPRGSQIGAWTSRQSHAVPDRAFLEAAWQEHERKFPGQVPMPPFWGGYILTPGRIEFWQGRPNRLHDRFCYLRQSDGSWNITRLAP